MPLIDMNVKHGRTFDEARSRLALAVDEARGRFGPLVRKVDWSEGRERVTLSGIGFRVEMWVDDQEVHAIGDIPLLSNLLGGQAGAGLKQIVQKVFDRGLPGPSRGPA